MNKPLVRLAVIGLGMAAKPHLEALAQLSTTVQVSGVFNRSPAKARALAETTGYRVFDSVEAIAADPETDGVILITPPDQRRALVETLAGAGKHILSEKPLERTTESARELVSICEQASVLFGVVFQQRFRASAQRLKELVDAGELGKLALIRAEIPWWREQSYYDVDGRGSYARDGGGVLISQAIHTLDLMLSLTGPALRTQAFCARTDLHQLEAEDFATAGIEFASGAVGSVVATTATFPGGTEGFVIDGSAGTATISAGHLKVNWRDGRSEELGEVSGTGGGADPMAFSCEWHRDLISDFAAAIVEGREPIISGREALRVHALIDAIVASSREGTIQAIAPETN